MAVVNSLADLAPETVSSGGKTALTFAGVTKRSFQKSAQTEKTIYNPPMLHDIAHDVYRYIRLYGSLSKKDVAEAIGRKHHTITRWEEHGQLPSAEQEAVLVKAANLTRLAFVEIMCKVLSQLVDREVIMAPRGDYLPVMPLARAAKLYRKHYYTLDPRQRSIIEEKLHQGRVLDAVTEQTCNLFEIEIQREIEKALASEGETPEKPRRC